MNLKMLQKNLGITFKDEEVLKNALVHRSWLNEHRDENYSSNERLEFLGDAILEFWITKNLYVKFPELPEGILTNIRAAIVCTENLATKSESLSVGKYILLSKGEEKTEGQKNLSILADTLEAIIGAIFIDSGIKSAEAFLTKIFIEELISRGQAGDVKDSKTFFQETAQANYKITPTYRILEQEGPDHRKLFRVGVFLDTKKIAEGSGWSKQEAEEKAAEKALTIIKNEVK